MIKLEKDDFIRLCSIADSLVSIGYEWAPDADDYGDILRAELADFSKEIAEIKSRAVIV